ncbi:MBL fold metallo-hydrolase [Aestuariirhabdus litorea]|uniref:MBL fold metallo-hydrolase n=1 Tax=Aestuariirhabdus litorea TaxID=2528527 RepID=A0A3P3VKY7_9GAMM|nr:MBL fold metallo-hydrolase [Aestuariirhabdus litorea]RRJ82386.1 MBL fold metallo-hydrolase [Aestuariirhabdus litorea]RWW92549.1 MBL fold metallo-hydrolase [Endozoicomonadaceae bacterium GTF-13]
MPIRQRLQHDGVEGVRVGRLNAGINTTFILYRIGSTLIDCGPSNQWRPVRQFLSERRVEQLLITHHHEDHSGNAARIARQFGIRPLAPELARTKLRQGFATPALQRLVWGRAQPVATDPLPERVELADGGTLYPIHTPGHARDLTCFFLPQQGWFFSGDLYIAKSLRMLRVDENLSQLIDSIGKVLELDFEVLFCPHRGIVEQGKASLQEKLDNLLSLCDEAQRLARQGHSTRQISDRLLGPEGWVARFTGYNISAINLVSGALAVDLSRPVTSRVELPTA